MEKLLNALTDNKKEQKIKEISKIFDEIKAQIETRLDEEKYETIKALARIEEAKYWAIKSII